MTGRVSAVDYCDGGAAECDEELMGPALEKYVSKITPFCVVCLESDWQAPGAQAG